MRNNNIEKVVADSLCLGCGTCAGVCPRNAITMSIDPVKGVYVPVIAIEKCALCGICFAVCPGRSVLFKPLPRELNIENKNILDHSAGYVGYAADRTIRHNSASGGITTSLLVSLLESGLIDGALVTGMREDRPWETRSFIARSKEDIVSASKSKYCPVSANLALREILETDGRYAVVGLPCHIQGIRKAGMVFDDLRRRIVLAIGLFCSHNDTFNATKSLIKKYAKGEHLADLRQINYRGPGWPGFLALLFNNNHKISVPYNEYIFFHYLRFYSPERCLFCVDALACLADITVMDAWLPEIRAQDNSGTSFVLVNTTAGEQFCNLGRSAGLLAISSASRDIIISSQGKDRINNRDLPVFMFFRKAAGKKTPEYDLDIPSPSLRNWVRGILINFNVVVSGSGLLRWLVVPVSILERYLLRLIKIKTS